MFTQILHLPIPRVAPSVLRCRWRHSRPRHRSWGRIRTVFGGLPLRRRVASIGLGLIGVDLAADDCRARAVSVPPTTVPSSTIETRISTNVVARSRRRSYAAALYRACISRVHHSACDSALPLTNTGPQHHVGTSRAHRPLPARLPRVLERTAEIAALSRSAHGRSDNHPSELTPESGIRHRPSTWDRSDAAVLDGDLFAARNLDRFKTMNDHLPASGARRDRR